MNHARSILLLVLTLGFSSLKAQEPELKIIKVPELLALTTSDDQKPRVVNFWATWCKPCVKELPYFLEMAKSYPEVEFIFISLDFSEQAEKVKSFAAKKGLNKHSLYLIDDLDYNSWIDKVSTEWSGAIPATIIISPSGKLFHEGELAEAELKTLLNSKFK